MHYEHTINGITEKKFCLFFMINSYKNNRRIIFSSKTVSQNTGLCRTITTVFNVRATCNRSYFRALMLPWYIRSRWLASWSTWSSPTLVSASPSAWWTRPWCRSWVSWWTSATLPSMDQFTPSETQPSAWDTLSVSVYKWVFKKNLLLV